MRCNQDGHGAQKPTKDRNSRQSVASLQKKDLTLLTGYHVQETGFVGTQQNELVGGLLVADWSLAFNRTS